MSGWLFLVSCVSVVGDLGANHGGYTRSVFVALRQILSAIGVV